MVSAAAAAEPAVEGLAAASPDAAAEQVSSPVRRENATAH
jgi:hypothetical protein